MRVIIDEREPRNHPWLAYLPQGWGSERARLETGDLALAAMPEAAVIERKTPSDLVACMISARERFERELLRSRYLGRFVVVVEGCAVACLAMFLGVEYEDALRHVGGHELTLGGLTNNREAYIARLFEVEISFLDRTKIDRSKASRLDCPVP